MNKQILLLISLIFVTMLTALNVRAASCPSLLGDWDVRCEGAYYEPDGGSYGYVSSHSLVQIFDQNNCRFHATRERLDEFEPIDHLTGIISLRQIRITGDNDIAVGRLTRRNTMKLTVSVVEVPVNNTVNTALCTAVRR